MPDPRPRRVLPLLVAITTTGVMTFTLITPALPDLADALGVSRGAIGLVQGAAAFPGVLLAIFVGHLSDLKGRRLVAQWALLVFGLAGVGAFFVTSYWPLVALRAIQGVGAPAMLSIGVMVIGDTYTETSERRRALGINAAAMMGSGIVAPILGGFLASGGAFRPFLVYAVAFPLAWWARLLPGRPEGSESAHPFRHVRAMFASLKARGRLSDYVGLLPFSAAILLVFNGVGFTAMPLFLEAEFSLASTGRGLVQAWVSIGSSVAALLAARFAARLGATRAVTIAFGLVVVGLAVVASAPNVIVVALGLWTLGSGFGTIFTLLSDFVTTSVPGTYRGAAVGTWLASIRVGQSAGPVIGAALITSIGRGTYWLAAAAVAVIALSWIPLRKIGRDWGGGRRVEVQEPLIQ